jgi:hypothetical protein
MPFSAKRDSYGGVSAEISKGNCRMEVSGIRTGGFYQRLAQRSDLSLAVILCCPSREISWA